MKKIRNWWEGFYNEYQFLIIGCGILVGVVGLIWGTIKFSINHHETTIESSVIEYVKSEEVNGHSYVTLRQQYSFKGYKYYVLHDPDCNCNN